MRAVSVCLSPHFAARIMIVLSLCARAISQNEGGEYIAIEVDFILVLAFQSRLAAIKNRPIIMLLMEYNTYSEKM